MEILELGDFHSPRRGKDQSLPAAGKSESLPGADFSSPSPGVICLLIYLTFCPCQLVSVEHLLCGGHCSALGGQQQAILIASSLLQSRGGGEMAG